MKSATTICVLVTFWYAGTASATATGSEPDHTPVIVSLSPTASSATSLVRVGDIADVSHGDNQLRGRISQLDIVALPPGGLEETVSQQQIDLRLRLAGIPEDAYQLRGAERVVVVESPVGFDDETVRMAIGKALADRIGVAPEDIEVRLTRPLPHIGSLGPSDKVQIRALVPDNVRTGRLRVDIGLYIDDRLHKMFNVTVEARIYAAVARATQRIDRGGMITEDNVDYDRHLLTLAASDRAARDPMGKTSARTILPGRIVGTTDVVEQQDPRGPVLVNRRDVVRLIARKGNLTVVVPAAEALEQGKAGDLIKVRNVQSKRIVTGRVVNQSEVEVSL
jgi:flagella basal body P-ring formation protein FlgA